MTDMRAFEHYHDLKVLPDTWIVLRVDGRGFSLFTADRFEKPFDLGFSEMMSGAAEALFHGLDARLAYTQSDEINVLLGREHELFGRSVEKLVSISASIAGGSFSLACGEQVQFDSRIWVGPTLDHVVDYFRWRQADAARGGLNGWCYWTLRAEGLGAAEATDRLSGLRDDGKNELLFARGINYNDLPTWHRRGVGVYRGDDGEVRHDRELPMKDAFAELIRRRSR